MVDALFRKNAKFVEMPPGDEAQLALPFDITPEREVYLWHGEKKTRRNLFGKKIIDYSLIQEDSGLPITTFIDAGRISELTDSALRYALRFADAANAVGWTRDADGGKGKHSVRIVATDAGSNSTLLKALYSGVNDGMEDTFIQNLHEIIS